MVERSVMGMPVRVLGASSVVDIAASPTGTHTCAARSSGAPVCWGANDFGQLGDTTTTTRGSATPVTGVSTSVSVAAGEKHSCARLSNGTVELVATLETRYGR